MIGQFPLWLILMTWYLQRHNAPRMTVIDCARMLRLLDDLKASIPLPRTRVENWLTRQALGWIERERDAVLTLRQIGAILTGTVSQN
jgi:hypothetical protein